MEKQNWDPDQKRQRTERCTNVTAASWHQNHFAQQQQVHEESVGEYPGFWLNRWRGDHHGHVDGHSLQDEVRSLTKQLIQLKQRLDPAAQNCSRACQSTARDEFNEARAACNPYEVLGEGGKGGLNTLFMNRSAIKLANVDALVSFDLIQPGRPDRFKFVDICGAPGGFSEYIIHRCCEYGIPSCQGYGMSLGGVNEHGRGLTWKLSEGTFRKKGTHCRYSRCTGKDGTGDIYNQENVDFMKLMMQAHGNDEADLVVADGGFDAQRDCEDQESLSQKLIVCEVAASLSCLRKGGTMVLKMFGAQTEVIRCVMAEIGLAFRDVLLTKPISSRPASAERYLVASGFQGLPTDWDPRSWRDRMFLGQASGLHQPEEHAGFRLIDIFDRDMLMLNLKACFAILSYMETKERDFTSGKEQRDSTFRGLDEIPIGPYRRGWFL
jgi:cap1 methyltransferase